MNEQTLQLAILKEAQARGLDPANLSAAQRRGIVMKIKTRKPANLLSDAAKMLVSVVKTEVLHMAVAAHIAKMNFKVCRSCPGGQYQEVEDDAMGMLIPACDACGCQGMGMRSKAYNATESCPKGFWDNTDGEIDSIIVVQLLVNSKALPDSVLDGLPKDKLDAAQEKMKSNA